VLQLPFVIFCRRSCVHLSNTINQSLYSFRQPYFSTTPLYFLCSLYQNYRSQIIYFTIDYNRNHRKKYNCHHGLLSSLIITNNRATLPANANKQVVPWFYGTNTPMTRQLQLLCQMFVPTHHKKSGRRCVGKTVNYYVKPSCYCVFTSTLKSFIETHISRQTIATYIQQR
jgi:hypothetical protein